MVCAQMKIWAFGEAAQEKLIQLGGPALPSFILIPSLRSSLHGKKMGKQWKQWLTSFFWALKSLQMVITAMKLKDACSLEGKL